MASVWIKNVFYFCFLFIVTSISNAATIVVNSSSDVSSMSECTLRDAVNSLNLASLKGGCSNTGTVFGDNDRIEIDLSVPYTIALENGPLKITTDMKIFSFASPEQAILRTAEGFLNRVVTVNSAQVTFSHFTISNGFVEHDDFDSDEAVGGGIYATNGAVLHLTECIVTDNEANIGGGVGLDGSSAVTVEFSKIQYNQAIAGGGIGAIDSSQVHVISESQIQKNRANYLGGGIGLRSSSYLQVSGSSVINNQALVDVKALAGMGNVYPEATNGGGISAGINSEVFVDKNSHISGNMAIQGAGIYLSDSSIEVDDSAIENNISEGVNRVHDDDVRMRAGFGGGINVDASSTAVFNNVLLRSNSAAVGGGAFVYYGKLSLWSSAVDGNSAQSWGGGLYYGIDSEGLIIDSTISKNIVGPSSDPMAYPGGGGVMATHTDNHLLFLHSTIVDNRVTYGEGGGLNISHSGVIIANSIIAGNEASSGADFRDGDESLVYSDGCLWGSADKTFDESIVVPGASLFPSESDILATNTLRNGDENPNQYQLDQIVRRISDDRTAAYTPLDGSPVVDAGVVANCVTPDLFSDQLGNPRNDGFCDIGSVELDQTSCYVIKALNGNVINFCL